MDQEVQSAPVPETVDIPVETPEAKPAEDPRAKELDEKLSAINRQKDELHGRATRAEAELKRLKQQSGSDSKTSDPFEVLALSKDYSVDELRVIEKHAKAFNTSMTEASKDPIVNGGIHHLRSQQKSVEATPGTRRATPNLDEYKKLSPTQRSEKMSFQAWKQARSVAGRSGA